MVVDIKIQAHMPKSLLRSFLQHIRDFDVKHFDEVEFGIIFRDRDKSPLGLSAEEAEMILRSIHPPFNGPMVRFRLDETGWPMDHSGEDA